jgi:hypothetical protein
MTDPLQALNSRWLQFMRAEDFDSAWRISDAVQLLQRDIDCSRWPRHEQFIWNGAALAERHVFVRCYHGLGDTIQYMRFLPALRASAREVTVWAQPALLPLLRFVDCADHVMPLHDGVPEISYDVDIELSELMHALRVTPGALGSLVPYIRVNTPKQRRRSQWHVGIVWSSGEWDARRSISPEQLASLGACAKIQWYVCQRGPALKDWHHGFGVIPGFRDILDEARFMSALDLLITVDTCSAHLGGALGIPTWTLLHHDADWRWLQNREDSPWYPTMRLFRQSKAGEWRSVLDLVAAQLRQLTAQ